MIDRLWSDRAAPKLTNYRGVMDDDEWPGFSPTCAQCLVQLVPTWEPPRPPVWRCP